MSDMQPTEAEREEAVKIAGFLGMTMYKGGSLLISERDMIASEVARIRSDAVKAEREKWHKRILDLVHTSDDQEANITPAPVDAHPVAHVDYRSVDPDEYPEPGMEAHRG